MSNVFSFSQWNVLYFDTSVISLTKNLFYSSFKELFCHVVRIINQVARLKSSLIQLFIVFVTRDMRNTCCLGSNRWLKYSKAQQALKAIQKSIKPDNALFKSSKAISFVWCSKSDTLNLAKCRDYVSSSSSYFCCCFCYSLIKIALCLTVWRQNSTWHIDDLSLDKSMCSVFSWQVCVRDILITH